MVQQLESPGIGIYYKVVQGAAPSCNTVEGNRVMPPRCQLSVAIRMWAA